MSTYTMKHFSFLLLFITCLATAQPATEDLKVGLILSGGGAKGMAHVGVLKEIERAGVRIDYIGGTSMGAIIGGLYACGYTADQLEQLLVKSDLNDLVNDSFDRDFKSFDDKEDSERYAITLPLYKGEIQFPISFSKGQNIYNLFVQLMHDQRNIRDFSQLPIPFYCMATDVDTGEKVLLDKGFLPLAVNASGALPTLFSPVKIQGRSLIDGGVSDNYPIGEMLEKDIDIIIGVDVQSSLSTEEEATSFSEILLRISSFQTEKEMAPKKEKTDIYIHPELSEYNLLSFSDQKAIIALGEQAGKEASDQLVALAKQQKPTVRPIKYTPTTFQLDVLSLSKPKNYNYNYLKGKIRLKTSSRYPFEKLRGGMTNLAATQNFEAFRYTLTTQNGKETLSLKLTETKHKALFRGSINYNDLMGASALVNLTRRHLLLKNDETSLDIIFGEYFRYAFSYFIDKGRFWSIGFSSTLDQFETQTPFTVKAVDSKTTFEASQIRVFAQRTMFYVQTLFREEMVLGAGLGYQRNRLKTNVFDSQKEAFLFADNAGYYSALGYLKIDTRDDAFYPKRGGFFDGSMEYYYGVKSFDHQIDFSPFVIGKAQMGATFPLGKKQTLSLNTMGAFTIGSPTVSTFDFRLGGYGNAPVLNYHPFVGLTQHHVGGDSFIKGEIIVDYEFIPKHHARLLMHAGIIKDDIFNSSDWINTPDYFGTALAYGLETFSGPVEFIAAYSPQIKRMVYHISLGWRF